MAGELSAGMMMDHGPTDIEEWLSILWIRQLNFSGHTLADITNWCFRSSVDNEDQPYPLSVKHITLNHDILPLASKDSFSSYNTKWI